MKHMYRGRKLQIMKMLLSRAKIAALLISVCLFSSSLFAEETIISNNKSTADKVLLNAKVYTVNRQQPWAEAVAIKAGKIIFVGSNKDVKNHIGEQTKTINLKGKMLLPGFQDAHVHPMEGMALTTFMGCDLIPLSETGTNPETWIDELKKCNKIDFPHGWILGGGHSMQDTLKLERHPRLLLDEAFPNKPAAFMEKSSHSMWVNSKALELAGLDKDTPDSQGGFLFRDPQTGQPTGILSDSSGDELMHIALAKSPFLQQARYESILLSQDYMAKHGITSATNARVYWQRGNLQPWFKAEKEKKLKTRSIMAIWAYPHLDDEFQLSQIKKMYRDNPNDLLRMNQVKFYSDGVIGNNSGAVIEPYNHLIHPFAKRYGLNYFTEKRMAKYITEIEKIGYDAHIHTIGDRAVRESLGAIEAAQKANVDLELEPRHQLTHVAIIRPNDIERFKQLNVTVNIQVNYLENESSKTPSAETIDFENIHIDDPDFWYKLLGDIDVEFFPVYPIHKSGGRVVLSSDWDVATIDPIYSIRNAVYMGLNDMPKNEALALAIKFYTLNPAYTMRHENLTGTIEVGKFADLTVLNKNLFDLSVEDITEAKVTMTLLAGVETYSINDNH